MIDHEKSEHIGLYGVGSSASIIIQIAQHFSKKVYTFSRSEKGKEFARKLGATWAGGSYEMPPVELDAAIIFAPAGGLIPAALKAVRKVNCSLWRHSHERHPFLPYKLLGATLYKIS
eukprot:TRINITY_DN17181_c0_g1_i1.p1 TRINITY_DN17181_c0_g1~~TRINITY_DN17181_c0_g1_i1.p1  ORF type:complete len:129 (-),score=20.26 TRINITY_DN17181_c0_g1_i1:66-416(-)